jgi:hypothetical protein
MCSQAVVGVVFVGEKTVETREVLLVRGEYYVDYYRRNVFYVKVLRGRARIRERARERAKWSPWNYIRHGWKEYAITPLGHVLLALTSSPP